MSDAERSVVAEPPEIPERVTEEALIDLARDVCVLAGEDFAVRSPDGSETWSAHEEARGRILSPISLVISELRAHREKEKEKETERARAICGQCGKTWLHDLIAALRPAPPATNIDAARPSGRVDPASGDLARQRNRPTPEPDRPAPPATEKG